MKINANDIRIGNVLEHDGKLWVVQKTMHTQPGKGGAYMQVEMKELQSGTKLNIRFRSGEPVEKAHLDQAEYQFLYEDGEQLIFMHSETFEQVAVSEDMLPKEQRPFLREGINVKLDMYDGVTVIIKLPETAIAEVVKCEASIKGQTVSSSYKPAILDNGVKIMVPQFLNTGDMVVVKIATQEYVERSNA